MIGLNKIGLNQVQLNRLRLNAPFPTCRKMAGGGGSGDGFPVLPGDVTRWHFGGLTNEMMAAMDDPRIEDADGKGRFLSFKNFAWSGMSGVGGYVQNFNDFRNNATVDKVRIDEQSSNSVKVTILATGINNAIYIPKNIYQFNKSYFIKISSEGYNEGDLSLSFYAPSTSTATTVKVPLNPNGITEIPAIKEDDFLAVYLDVGGKVGSITIEQLPLYPGFILGDGVDNFAVTEKELNFEDTYTVYTAFIPFQNNPTRNMILCGADSKKTFTMQYSSLVYVSFIAGNNYYINADFVNGLNLFACKRNGNNICIKNLLTNKVVTGTCGDWVENAGLYYLWKNATSASFARAGIAGQIIDNGHFTTDEEDENILNWHKKQYPWLFPDQAWTVVGKTNEDEDRATIANITGNGNDLVLSNFGFAKGSGYGLYYQYFGEKFATTNGEIEDGGWNKIDNYNISHNKRIPINSIGKCYWSNEVFANGIKLRFKLTGMTEGDVLAFGYAGTYDLTYTSDGIYVIDLPPVDKTYGFSLQSSLTENLPTTPVTIKLLPFEYEGYLVTDGVDDKVASVNAVTLNKDFTVVGEWRFKETEIRSNCGIVVERVLFVYNIPTGIRIYIHEVGGNFTELQNIKSLKAICSNGIVYDENWNPISVKVGSLEEYSNKLLLGYLSNLFTQIAFKNMSIYSNQLLSKEDCIKAYNYLQTLKAK